ncbi:thiamine ABC transporter substrate binding subunit [Enterobacteriaceae bacterium LUAb1]
MLKNILSLLLLLTATSALAAKPVLTVYTYDAFAADWGPGPVVKKNFEAQCHCELKFIALEDGVALLNRLRIEGKNSKADVVLGLDNNLITVAEKSGLFAPSRTDISKLTLPGGWHNHTFIPFDYGYFAFIYDKHKLKNPPASLQELVDSPEKWRVIYEDPRTSTPGLGLLLWMQKVFGEHTESAWQKLAQKTVTVTKGWSEAYGLFLKGEGDLVLSYTTSPAYHLIDGHTDNYAAANFTEGHYLQTEVAARLAHSQQPELAEQFMQFIVSPLFQSAIPTGNWMYPVVDIALPAGFTTLITPRQALQFRPEEIASQRSHWITLWQQALIR